MGWCGEEEVYIGGLDQSLGRIGEQEVYPGRRKGGGGGGGGRPRGPCPPPSLSPTIKISVLVRTLIYFILNNSVG